MGIEQKKRGKKKGYNSNTVSRNGRRRLACILGGKGSCHPCSAALSSVTCVPLYVGKRGRREDVEKWPEPGQREERWWGQENEAWDPNRTDLSLPWLWALLSGSRSQVCKHLPLQINEQEVLCVCRECFLQTESLVALPYFPQPPSHAWFIFSAALRAGLWQTCLNLLQSLLVRPYKQRLENT